jgi:acyl carrier protein
MSFSTGAIVFVIVITVVLLFLLCGVMQRGARHRFQDHRNPVTDEEFLRKVGIAPTHNPLALVLRRAIADQCGVKPEVIWDTDQCDWIAEKLTWDGWDEVELAMFLEKKLGIKIDDSELYDMPYPGGRRNIFGKKKNADCDTVGGWICAAASYIQERCMK